MFVYPWLEHTPFIECLKWGDMTRFWSLQVISVFSSFPSLKIDFHPRVENARLAVRSQGNVPTRSCEDSAVGSIEITPLSTSGGRSWGIGSAEPGSSMGGRLLKRISR